jgi:hypothetical protein
VYDHQSFFINQGLLIYIDMYMIHLWVSFPPFDFDINN